MAKDCLTIMPPIGTEYTCQVEGGKESLIDLGRVNSEVEAGNRKWLGWGEDQRHGPKTPGVGSI